MNQAGKAPDSPVKRRRNATNVTEYFKTEDGKKHCTITGCTKSYALATGTTNLMYHLSSDHGIILNPNDDVEEDEPSFSSKLSPKKQEFLDNLLLKFIVDDLQPFHITMSKSFRELLHGLNPRYILPDEKTVKQRVLDKYEKLKPKVEKLAMESNSLKSWTSDGWSSNKLEPYLLLTTHFIDQEFKYFEFVYDFTLFPHPHDQINSSEKLFTVSFDYKCAKFGIRIKLFFLFLKTMGDLGVVQTHSMTTDNAYNVVAAIEDLKLNEELREMTHQRCGTHVINLIVQSGLDDLGESYDKIRFYCNKVWGKEYKLFFLF